MSKRLVIAIDCDDVLLASTPLIVETYNRLYGTEVTLETAHTPGAGKWGVATREEVVKRFNDLQQSEEYKTLAPTPETIQAIADLAAVHELHLITARPLEIELATVEMINRYFKGLFTSIEHVGHVGSKGKACVAIGADVLIDDNLRHVVDAGSHGLKHPILFGDYPWQTSEAPATITRCKTWTGVRDYLDVQ